MNEIIQEPTTEIDNGALPAAEAVNVNTLNEWNKTLNLYSAGKRSIDDRVVSAERWWKLRNWYEEDKKTDKGDAKAGFRTNSAWLHNTVAQKHAEYVEAYPEPNFFGREANDKVEAWALSKVVPVILKRNDFETTYDMNGWQKYKTGTGVYKTIWDSSKENGLGDISICRKNLLGLFWEPGVVDIQDSPMFFDVEMRTESSLINEFPQLKDRKLSSSIVLKKMPRDDVDNMSDMYALVDVYYKKVNPDGKKVLHYAKYVGDVVLYATENDTAAYKTEQKQIGVTEAVNPDGSIMEVPQYAQVQHTRAEDGMYAHGLYPFVFDPLFPIEDSPTGYGFIDICANSQTRIDLIDQAILENTMASAKPRVYARKDGQINEEELLNTDKAVVHYEGNFENEVHPINVPTLNGNHISILDQTITELRETSSNTEAGAGIAQSGVTAASAYAALQEASGKISRAAIRGTYRAAEKIYYLVVELIRERYDAPRQFRIIGDMGKEMYIPFDNSLMQPQWQGMSGDVDLGYKQAIFDIEVAPEKKSTYSKISQNEYAIQLYGLGMFNPQMTDQALLCLGMMDFDGKDELMQKISMNGTLFQKLEQAQMVIASLTGGQLVPGYAGPAMPSGDTDKKPDLDFTNNENPIVERARERAQSTGQPGGAA